MCFFAGFMVQLWITEKRSGGSWNPPWGSKKATTKKIEKNTSRNSATQGGPIVLSATCNKNPSGMCLFSLELYGPRFGDSHGPRSQGVLKDQRDDHST